MILNTKSNEGHGMSQQPSNTEALENLEDKQVDTKNTSYKILSGYFFLVKIALVLFLLLMLLGMITSYQTYTDKELTSSFIWLGLSIFLTTFSFYTHKGFKEPSKQSYSASTIMIMLLILITPSPLKLIHVCALMLMLTKKVKSRFGIIKRK